jgi:hypothetical protein
MFKSLGQQWFQNESANWKLISKTPPISTLSLRHAKTPEFEIRTHKEKGLIETWFYYIPGESNELKFVRISARSVPHFVVRWRCFLDFCESQTFKPHEPGFWNYFFDRTILEDKLWGDDQGRCPFILCLIQMAGWSPREGLRLSLFEADGFPKMSFELFREWLDLLEEHHRPYSALPTRKSLPPEGAA